MAVRPTGFSASNNSGWAPAADDDGGGDEGGEPVEEELEPGTDGDVKPTIVDGEGTFDGGMLDGWTLFDPASDIISVSDGDPNAGEFTVTWDVTPSTYRWATSNRQIVANAPFFAYPHELTGDFEIELSFIAPANAATPGSLATGNFDFCLLAMQRPETVDSMNHYISCGTGRTYPANGQFRAGMNAGDAGHNWASWPTVVYYNVLNWIKLKREGSEITAEWKADGGVYAAVHASLPADKWDWAGSACLVGFGMATDQQNYISIKNINLTGTEVA
mgnify:CR=1 FL=1